MALSFDKTVSYDTGISPRSLNLTQSATVSIWAKRASTDIRSAFGSNPYDLGGGDKDVFTFFCNTGQLLWVRITNASGTLTTVFSGAWPSGWTNFVATYDGSNLKTYINGIYESGGAATGNLLQASTTTGNFIIGRRGNHTGTGGASTAWNWYGDLAEISIWNVVLNASEIASLGKGFNANRIRPQSLKTNSRLIRTLADAKGASTASGTVTAAAHPRVY